MLVAKRFKIVVVFYAIVGLLLALSDVILPELGLFKLWLNSWVLELLIFIALWLIAPFAYKYFDD